jgi:hypothetical protein
MNAFVHVTGLVEEGEEGGQHTYTFPGLDTVPNTLNNG